MLKKIDKIFIIIMTIALVINILAIGFLFVDSVSAAESNYTCQFEESTGDFIIDSVDFNEAGDYQCPPPGTTRVQVAIPGLTKTCTYKTWELDDQGEPTDVAAPCYYAASLPDFVRRIYTFSIGIIAVIAVFMIMIAGLTLIFAAGNAGAIARAKSRITVSILGVVLALLSYVILDTLNPRLTNLSLPGVTPIEGIDQPDTKWCDEIAKTNNKFVFSENKTGTKTVGVNKTECSVAYYYGEIKQGKFETQPVTCMGKSGCKDNTFCVPTMNRYFCLNTAEFCEKYDKKKCEEANFAVREHDKLHGCVFDKKASDFGFDWAIADKCVFGEVLTATRQGKDEINNQVECRHPDAKGTCWKEKDGKVIGYFGETANPYCKDPGDIAIKGTNYICVKNSSGDFKRLRNEVYTCPDSGVMNCSEYKNKGDCGYDYCGFGACKWVSAYPEPHCTDK